MVELKAIHLAGMDNEVVDLLSRKKVSPLEWSLDRSVVEHLFTLLGRPHIDLFASAENAQLSTFCLWWNESLPLAVDALSIPSLGMLMYSYLPVTLVQHVVRKMAAG